MTGAWRDTYPADQIDNQIAFYEKLRDRKNGAYAEFYEPTVEVLQALKKRMKT